MKYSSLSYKYGARQKRENEMQVMAIAIVA
jgi:hypothetical protein